MPCLLAAVALSGSAGCGVNTDPSIFVELTVKDPTVDVANSTTLGTAITGGFTLEVHLGARAAGSSEVAVQQFELVSKDENTVVVESLPLAADGQPLPLTVEPDTDEDVAIVIDLGSKLLAKDIGQKLCNFGEVKYRGSITDSLRGTTLPVLTDPVTVTGCVPGM